MLRGMHRLCSRWLSTVAATLLLGGVGAAQVMTEAGLVEGTPGSDPHVLAFRGLPYAAPPVGERRWQPPGAGAPWGGVRKAKEFGPRCVQARIFADMMFRDAMSEDCLYLNVWTPVPFSKEHRPVMVWIHGGGFVAGSASEPRQDGERLAAKGVVVVSFNYRLGALGFLAHPELTKESGHRASGNYGLLDQVAALRWVRTNIAAFGGDPANVTIFGESAGSLAVSALMASPLAEGLFQRAVGESGAFFAARNQAMGLSTLAESEEQGRKLAASLGADSLAALRSWPAEDVLRASMADPGQRFGPSLDGYLLPGDVYATFAAGKQSRVPLLAGWNADEIRSSVTLAPEGPTARGFADRVRARFGDRAEALLRAYPAGSDAEALESAASLASDLFIGYVTWKWIEVHSRTGLSPVFRYSFDRAIPVPPGHQVNGVPATAVQIGARHAGEIEYVFGTLGSLPAVPWQPEDRQLSELMMKFWTNFARSGDPNGESLPQWPRYEGASGYQVLHLDDRTHAAPDGRRSRYETLDAYMATRREGSDR
jgi:para-nitrobenzyl esterase